MNLAVLIKIQIRTPRERDIAAILTVVRACEPFLTPDASYVFWMTVHNYGQICAVAEMGSELVGWCSILPVSRGRYFLHQLAVIPNAREQGIGEVLLTHLLAKLKAEFDLAEIEFTIDRKNSTALDLIRTVAHAAGMRLVKRSGFVALVEAGCDEELWAMVPALAGELEIVGQKGEVHR